MLPPTLERYFKKITSKQRQKNWRTGTRTLMRLLFQTMRARFLSRLRSASINPDYNDSVASGQLANSLRLRTQGNNRGFVATVFTTARHYNFIDTGEATSADKPTRSRIKAWVESRFGISRGTSDDAIIENPGVGGSVAYGDMIDLIMLRIQDRMASGYYQGLDLTSVIGKTTSRPGGEEIFEDLLDFWISFYTMDRVA